MSFWLRFLGCTGPVSSREGDACGLGTVWESAVHSTIAPHTQGSLLGSSWWGAGGREALEEAEPFHHKGVNWPFCAVRRSVTGEGCAVGNILSVGKQPCTHILVVFGAVVLACFFLKKFISINFIIARKAPNGLIQKSTNEGKRLLTLDQWWVPWGVWIKDFD